MAIDIESCTELESESSKKVLNGLKEVEFSTRDGKVLDESGFMSNEDKFATEYMQIVIDINPKIDGVVMGRDLVEKEKRKSLSAKKPPKPPRPPRDSPLDDADKKLVKEIAELTMIKRARIERMKALKKSRAAKASGSSSSLSSNGSYLALLLTFVFCLVLLYHGFSSEIKLPASLGHTLFSTVGTDSRYILVEDRMGISSLSSSPFGSSNLVEPTLNLDGNNFTKRSYKLKGTTIIPNGRT